MWGLFSKKKKNPTVSEVLEETMNKTMTPESGHQSFFQASESNTPTMSDLDAAETMSEGGTGMTIKEKKFLNLMEVLNGPHKQPDLLESLNNFFAKGFSNMSPNSQTRRLHSSVSKSITAESFYMYKQKLGRITNMISKNQEQDKRHTHQFEAAFQRKQKRALAAVEREYFNGNDFLPDVAKFNKESIRALSEQLEDKADLVDEAIHYGVKARFPKYLDIMSDFNQVEETVLSELERIAAIREVFKETHDASKLVAYKIILKKKQADNKRAVLEKLSMFEQINTNLNNILQDIKENRLNEAVALYKKQEEILFNKLKGYCLSEKFEVRLNTTRNHMIESAKNFIQATIKDYLTECLHFSTKKPENVGEASRLLNEMTLIANSSMNMSMDVSILERFEHNSVPLYLFPSYEPTKKDEIDLLSLVASNFLSIKDFRVDGISESIVQQIRLQTVELSDYLQEVFDSENKNANIVSALIIANTIFERFITRFSHLLTEIVERILKKFYGSMKSKFLRERMAVSTLDVFGELITLKVETLEIFRECQVKIFGSEANLRKIEMKDFIPFFEILEVFNTNLKLLFENNMIVVNESKLDKSIVDRFIGQLDSMQSYEYNSTFSKTKVVLDYYKAVYNWISQSINDNYSKEKWVPAELDYSTSETLTHILAGRYLKRETDNILNDTQVGGVSENPQDETPPHAAVLIFKNEIHVNNEKFLISSSYSYVISAIKEFLQLGSAFVDHDSEIVVATVKRVTDVIVVSLRSLVKHLGYNSVHTDRRSGHLSVSRLSHL